MSDRGVTSTWGDIKSLPGPLKFKIYLRSGISPVMDLRNGIVKYHGVTQSTKYWNDNDEVEYWDEPVFYANNNQGGRSKRRRTKRRTTRKRKTTRKK